MVTGEKKKKRISLWSSIINVFVRRNETKPAFVIHNATKAKQKASAQFECGKRAQLIDKGDSLWSNVINVLLRETRKNHGKVT